MPISIKKNRKGSSGEKKSNKGKPALSDIKMFYRSSIIKPVGHHCMNIKIDQ